MITPILHSQNCRFKLPFTLKENWFFLHKHIHVCTKLWCTYPHPPYFGKQLFEHYWHETAVFPKHKPVILAWEKILKYMYNAWQLSFALFYVMLYWVNIRNYIIPYNARQRIRFFFTKRKQTITLDIHIRFREQVCDIKVYFCDCIQTLSFIKFDVEPLQSD